MKFDMFKKRKVRRKALALQTIAVYVIMLISLALIMVFLYGPVWEGSKGLFCKIYSFFGEPPSYCEIKGCKAERVSISENSIEEISREIAAYSILCFKSKSGCLEKEGVKKICYNLILENNSNEITEYNITKILKEEKGCQVLQNSIIITKNGKSKRYDCGVKDSLKWEVENHIIKEQKIILIKYDLKNNVVVIE